MTQGGGGASSICSVIQAAIKTSLIEFVHWWFFYGSPNVYGSPKLQNSTSLTTVR